MVCRNCGNEIGSRRDCGICGYDPAKDDPGAKKNVNAPPAAVKLPPIEVVLKKRVNVPAILGFVFSLLMWIPIPVVGWATCPSCFLVSSILTIIGFAKAKACRSGRGFSIVSLIFCILFALVVIALIVLIVLATMGIIAEAGILAALGYEQ